ncbi:MAG: RsmE family RNA methyltransferase [Opitutaceae bacterium]
MPDFRVHCAPPAAGAAEITLSPAETQHLVTVNRARVGAPVVAFDGSGAEWSCELVTDRRQGAVLRVVSSRRHPALPCGITLAQALPKGAAMDGIVRKATEIGATRIIPLETERTQVHLEGDRSEGKVEKWRTAALEAAKQCGNPFLPEIAPVQNLETCVAAADQELKLVASLHAGARSLKDVLAARKAAGLGAPRTAIWLIGPEGDFSPAELTRVTAAGFEPVTLGPLTLRCETAALCALAILRHELLA